MLKKTTVTTLALVVAAVVAGCGSGSGENRGEPVTDGTFRYGIEYDTGGSFDPYTNLKVLQLAPLTYDSLIAFTEDGKLVSNIAERWSGDARRLTFTIKKGITCSDGTPLDAVAVKRAIDFINDPANRVGLVGTVLPLARFTTKADAARRTVEIELDKPFSFALQSLGRTPIVCPKGLADPKALAKQSFGSGPYVLERLQSGRQLTFARRAGYTWGPDGAATSETSPRRIEVRVVTNQTTAANLLTSGQLNAASVSGQDGQRLRAQKLFAVETNEQFGLFAFNQREGRLARDRALRVALLTGVDLDELAKIATSGTGKRATAFVPPGRRLCDYDSATGSAPAYNPTRAKQMLSAAGWEPGPGGIRRKDGKELKLDLHYQTYVLGSAVTGVVERLAEQWKALGVRTELTGDDLNATLNVLFTTGNWDVYWGQQAFQYPSDLLIGYTGPPPPNGQNFSGIENATVDKLAQTALAKAGDRSCPDWKAIESALIADGNVLPIADAVVPLFGKDATFEVVNNILRPTTIKLFK